MHEVRTFSTLFFLTVNVWEMVYARLHIYQLDSGIFYAFLCASETKKKDSPN